VEVRLLRQPFKFIKRAKGSFKTAISVEIEQIALQPKIGKQLTGTLKQFRSHRFTHVGVQYRIAYKVNGNVLIILIASRENFYRDLRV
jgi:hypothetical protein